MFQAQQPTLEQTASNPIVINLPPVDPNHERDQIKKSFPKRVMMLLSILQIVCGGLVFLLQIIQYFVERPHNNWVYIVGWGIWTGPIFAASGLVGLIAASKPSKCIVKAFLVLNIISAAFTMCLIVPIPIGIAHTAHHHYYKTYGGDYSVFLALHCLIFILGLVQAVTAIVASRFSCGAVCCQKSA